MAYRFVRQRRGRYSVREMATLFGVSSNALCCWAKEGVSERRREADADLAELIRRIRAARHCRYGSPRVREALRQDYGKRASLKKAARLMRERGLNARQRRQFVPAADSRHGLPICANLLNREFRAAEGEKRVSDIVCLRALGGGSA